MNRIENSECLCFDDVILVPQYSKVASRHDVEVLATDFHGNSITIGDRELELPIFAAPMDTVVGKESVGILTANGICPIIHRYNTIAEQVEIFEVGMLAGKIPVGAAIGATDDYIERARSLYAAGCRLFCVDVAHGHHRIVEKAIGNLQDKFPKIKVMTGNIGTLDAFQELVEWGADFVRCGISSGAACSTQVITGHGMPTLQAVLDCADSTSKGYIVADGGIKSSGDIVKSFAAGADFVMLGSMLACHEESPGAMKVVDGVQYKMFRGMASKSAQMEWRGRVSVSEGASSWHLTKGKLADTISDILGGIRSGCSYAGVDAVSQLCTYSEFRRVSQNSIVETRPRFSHA